MTERHIDFRPYQVRAALDGRLSQTRRVLKPDPDTLPNGFAGVRLPYAPGDRLWVREAFSVTNDGCYPSWLRFRADPEGTRGKPYLAENAYGSRTKWKPSIHMPRSASRLTLTVTDVRVQRLQEISEEDAIAEGCAWSEAWEGYTPCPQSGDGRYYNSRSAVDSFEQLWTSLHGPDALDANQWVCALTFTVRHGNIDTPAACPAPPAEV